MFGTGSFATVWNVTGKDKYYEVELSTSRKKEDGSFETDFSSKFTRFVGKAKDKVVNEKLSRKDRIKLTSCGVSNFYNKEKGREYVNYVVFDFDVLNRNDSDSSVKSETKPVDIDSVEDTIDDDLPF